MLDVASKTLSRRTTVGTNERPEWTPDSKRILYRSDRSGIAELGWQPADGNGSPEQIATIDDDPFEGIISPDGKTLVYRTGPTAISARDIFYIPLDGDRVSHIFIKSPSQELMPRFSPDGRYLAYQANETGAFEIYVRPFPGPGAPIQASLDGGIEPVWSRDGHRLFFRSGPVVYAATVTTSPAFSVVRRDPFVTGVFETNPSHANYDVTPDGSHLLMVKQAGEDAQLVVVYNWVQTLRAREGQTASGTDAVQ